MAKTEVVTKIRKLFALAESDFEAEAESAILKAQELLLQHGLTMTDVEADPSEEKPKVAATEAVDHGRKNVPGWHKRLAVTIARNFRCEVFTDFYDEYDGSGRHIKFLGLEEDAVSAKVTMEFAIRAGNAMWKRFKKEHVHSGSSRTTTAIRNDYFRGFVKGIETRFAEQVTEKALVLVKDAVVEREYRKMNLRKGQASRQSTAGSEHATSAGYRDGYSVQRDKYVTE
jgi:hypothetical protein